MLKLADLGLETNHLVEGTNDIRPAGDDPGADVKPDAETTRYGFTETADKANASGRVGVLERAVDNFTSETRRQESELADLLGKHVESLSGSSAMRIAAVGRFKNRARD